MRWLLGVLLPAFAATMALNGCSRAQEAFETVQICVANQRGVAELKSLMGAVAQSEGLQFIDNSAQQAADLKAIGADRALKRDPALAIDFHIEGPNGLGVTASNLGLPPYQVGIGFTEGNDTTKAHRLAGQMIGALSQRWDVQQLGPGSGVPSMKACGA